MLGRQPEGEGLGAGEDEERIGTGDDPPLDREQVAQRGRGRPGRLGRREVEAFGREPRPFPRRPEGRRGDGGGPIGPGERPAEAHQGAVRRARRRLLEGDDRRGHQGVAELAVAGPEPMDAEQRHAVEQVIPHDLAIVDVEELGGDEPDRQAPFGQPGVGQQEEIRIKAGQAVGPDADPPPDGRGERPLGLEAQVVVADVGGVGQDQVEAAVGGRRIERGEVAFDHLEAEAAPEPARDRGEGGVELDAGGAADRLAGGRPGGGPRRRRRCRGPGRGSGSARDAPGPCRASRRARRSPGPRPGGWRTGRAGSARRASGVDRAGLAQ